ncbi:hypothetical protein TNCT_108041 [Trichonephila clavata]|uniref:Uncharacterized protein n=1 Tax=Trichonephila clavata TaxID=2740835 RepID=A0A8X6IHU2_TRICU|nr:hypothetical protein TNCT_108041 [Trichonephila clavata]
MRQSAHMMGLGEDIFKDLSMESFQYEAIDLVKVMNLCHDALGLFCNWRTSQRVVFGDISGVLRAIRRD